MTEQQTTENIFDQIVGEGKKFSDPEALAKGKLESDNFIEQLKTELKELRSELERRLSAEEVLEQIKKNSYAPKDNDSLDQQGNQPVNDRSYSPSDIQEVIRREIDAREIQRTAQQNKTEAERFLIEKYGSKQEAQEAIINTARQMGVNPQFLIDAASKSPNALYSLMGIRGNVATQQTTGGSELKGTVNTQAQELQLKDSRQHGTREYYEEMRKTNPRKYFDAKTQNEIFKAVKEGTYKL